MMECYFTGKKPGRFFVCFEFFARLEASANVLSKPKLKHKLQAI